MVRTLKLFLLESNVGAYLSVVEIESHITLMTQLIKHWHVVENFWLNTPQAPPSPVLKHLRLKHAIDFLAVNFQFLLHPSVCMTWINLVKFIAWNQPLADLFSRFVPQCSLESAIEQVAFMVPNNLWWSVLCKMLTHCLPSSITNTKIVSYIGTSARIAFILLASHLSCRHAFLYPFC